MNFQQTETVIESRFQVSNYLPLIGEDALIRQILSGLCAEKKHIDSMFFYDAAGSKLFEAITRLPEYYPTRTEKGLLREAAREIGSGLYDADIVEIGSGDCSKISLLIEAIPPEARSTIRHVPVDVSQSAIEEAAGLLSRRFPRLSIYGIVADFMSQLELIPEGTMRLFCFFGSTIGNLSRTEAAEFMKNISRIMQPNDQLLLGLDMVKDRRVLEAAYNDTQAVTAAFNRNILHAVNHLAGTDFEPMNFEHLAYYNPESERIEMHLKAGREMTVTCPHIPEPIVVEEAETIHTENSHKFSAACIEEMERTAGLAIGKIWTDRNKWFSLVHFKK